VSNVGTAVSSGTISVAGTLPAGLTFVAGTGAGWSCAATGQVVTCTNSTVLAVGASSSYALTVTAGPAAVGTVMHTVAVTGTGDLNPVNNSWTDPTIVRATPTPTFSFNPSAIIVGQQAGMSVTVGTPFPHDVTGSVTVTFGSNAAVPADDPAIQFATGGRTVTFTIPAESTQARFGSSTTTGPVGFQPGTVSGTLTFQGSLIAGTVKGAFSTTLAVPKQAPKILDVRTRTQDGFAAVIQLSSSPRDVTSLKLTFNTTVAVRLSCGSAAGCTTSGNTMTLDVAGLFSDWFQRDATFGSLSTITVPLTIPSGVGGTVAVTIRNSQGESNAGVFNLP
jgi:hypothetical protein